MALFHWYEYLRDTPTYKGRKGVGIDNKLWELSDTFIFRSGGSGIKLKCLVRNWKTGKWPLSTARDGRVCPIQKKNR